MMGNRKRQKTNRIPVRFVDEEAAPDKEVSDEQSLKPDRQADRDAAPTEGIRQTSSYGGEPEARPRTAHGAEQGGQQERARTDDDTTAEPFYDELPEGREVKGRAYADSSIMTHAADGSNSAGARAQAPGAEASAGPILAELVATRAELRRVEAERAELLDKLTRRQADFDNYRKRVERERADAYNHLVGEVVGKLLPVLDNLRRALDAEASLEASESEGFRHFLHGVELIFRQLGDVLEELGVQAVPAVGERFDPHFHEAVATEQTDDFEPDTVMQELVRGYRIGGKLLRPAMVKVATR